MMENECFDIVKDSNVQLTEQLLKSFLDFTRCHCLQLFLVFLDNKFFAFQSNKTSYLNLRLSLDDSFVFSLEFQQFDDKLYYVALRTSLCLQGVPMQHLCDTDSLVSNQAFIFQLKKFTMDNRITKINIQNLQNRVSKVLIKY